MTYYLIFKYSFLKGQLNDQTIQEEKKAAYYYFFLNSD